MTITNTTTQTTAPSSLKRKARLCRLVTSWAVALGACGVCTSATAGRHADPVQLEFRRAAGVKVRVIRVDLQDPRVRISILTAKGFPRSAERFGSMVARSGAVAAVTGSYFSKRSLRPIGDIVSRGRTLMCGNMGTALAIDADNQASIIRLPRGRKVDWYGYRTVLGCGPMLVHEGKLDVRARQEGFRDPHVMGRTRRMGVGLISNKSLLLVHTMSGVSFREFGKVMLALKCTDAMNLDAGASLAMYHRGRTLETAGRKLTNVLAVSIVRSHAKL